VKGRPVKKIAILVPGIMGTELRLDGEVIWPGSVLSFVTGFKRMPELLREDLVPTDVIRSFSISTQYQSLIDDLGTCGFRESHDPPTLFVFPYDWRKDNREAAAKLADHVDAAVAAQADEADVSIVAHSMGGLVARYFLESDEFAQRAGLKAVRRLITLATPHGGSPLALTAAVGLEKRLFLSKDQVLMLTRDTRYPSLYQLLPPPGEPFAWDEDATAEFASVDIYNQAVSAPLGLVSKNLQAAVEFRSGLDLRRRPSHVRYFYFAGTRQSTMMAVGLLRVGSKYRTRPLDRQDAGDGTVPSWSAVLSAVQGEPVGGEHSTIYRNGSLRRTLAGLLGAPGVLAAVEDVVEVAVRERVIEPDETVHATLAFPRAMGKLEGDLRLDRAQVDQSGSVSGFAPFETPRAIRYEGVEAETLGLAFPAPSVRGIYRVSYYAKGESEPAGQDELFVQEPSA
jgi:pimeloyl-ACP methyl ester carboxylesterase